MNEERKPHGVGTYYYLNGTAEIGRYEEGKDVGEGVWWSADRQTAWRLKDGEMVEEISRDAAAAIAKDHGLRMPPPCEMVRRAWRDSPLLRLPRLLARRLRFST